jgi:hypothetical protein
MSKVDISILVTAVIFEGNLAPCVNLLKMCSTGLSTFKYERMIPYIRINYIPLVKVSFKYDSSY